MEIEVPYVKQDTPRNCWQASYKMMLKYKSKAESLANNLPNDAQMQERGILDSELGPCARRIGLTTTSGAAIENYEKLEWMLENYGPLWCSGYWATDFEDKSKTDYKHIVVVRGVRKSWPWSDPEVFVNDPFRGYKAAPKPSWWSWDRFYYKLNKVPYAIQFWF